MRNLSNLLSFNDSLYNFFIKEAGITLRQGMCHLDLFPNEEYRRIWDNYYKQAIKHNSYKSEYQTFKGSLILYLNINAIKVDNKISYLSIFAKDITENKKLENMLKKSEEKFSKMFMLSPNAMSINDLADNNRIIECNNAFTEHIGYSYNEIIGKTTADLNLYADPDMRSKVIGLIDKDRKIINFEYSLKRKNGNIRQGLLSTDVVDINGNACVITSLVDITDRVEMEKKLNSSLLEKEALLRELYHRTKNNMQVICAMLILYSSQTNNSEIINIFKEIELKIRAMALVHKKLYESNDLSNINLKEYLYELSELHKKSYGAFSENIELELNIEEINIAIDIAVPCGLVINELFSNTFKYAFPYNSKGKITLDIKLTEENYININYSDNGIGLPPGFDFHRDGRMGIKSIISIIESQLQGSFHTLSAAGFSCNFKFKRSLYETRV